ncbi:hypothetical protein Forpe1208_v010235 [Fusarium oxysporum f. sp. rapae]|uniref:Uncharacterized protein n=1 Tax=Fusarium oxysporum f. sp. rapae TaxID=485398 RepID=A0A8J5NRV8_FUSOX|nr:hypothetical protein Forpe1208_v010235 [Fusarium oxysporum f. sp. rapae]
MPRELEAQLCTNGLCQRMGRPPFECLLYYSRRSRVGRAETWDAVFPSPCITEQFGLGEIYTRCTVYGIWHWYRGSSSLTDINLKHEYLGTDVPPPFSKHTNRQGPELGRTVRGERGVRIEVIVKGPGAMQSAKMDGIAWHGSCLIVSTNLLINNANIMKYSAVTLLAALAAYSQAQSISIPGGDEVSSIIGDVSSRIDDASSIIEDVSTRVGDEVSSRVGDISSRISTATETGASTTVTDASTATESAGTESETGSNTVDTSALASVTSALASASSAIEDEIASLSSDLATATGTASEAIESKIAEATSRAGAIESSAGAAASSATGDNAGAMPTAAVAMGALMGGAALFANM